MDDWIEWNGGDCPVDPDTLVCIRMRDGEESLPEWRIKASGWFWHHRDSIGDIVAYLIIKEPTN